MANYKTGAQRYNDRMDKIFAKSKELNEKYHGKDSFGSKHKALEKAKSVHEVGKGHGVMKTAKSEHTKHYDQKSKSWLD